MILLVMYECIYVKDSFMKKRIEISDITIAFSIIVIASIIIFHAVRLSDRREKTNALKQEIELLQHRVIELERERLINLQNKYLFYNDSLVKDLFYNDSIDVK